MTDPRAIVDYLKLLRHKRPTRRAVVQQGLAATGLLAMSRSAFADQYGVGIARGSDAYGTTLRALDASGEWSAINFTGRVVVIKPNLVGKALPQTGTTTDPQVVRAVVDRALAGGAIFVMIVEAGPHGANFAECGYSFFNTYDPGGRVHLVDLSTLPRALVNLSGWIYRAIYSYPYALNRSYLFINVAKMKTHAEALVTLATKNLFGLPAIAQYPSTTPGGRFGMHDRGLNQAVVDNYLLRPPDFNIIDGIVAMEGEGPWAGRTVAMNTVLAGRNTLAVDRVSLLAMGVPQNAVRYLNYMSLLGLGPSGLSEITTAGDTLMPRTFQMPARIPPSVDPPGLSSAVVSPSSGQSVSIFVKFYETCDRTVEILRVSDDSPVIEVIRRIAPLSTRGVGWETLSWDGRAESGQPAPPGRYAVHVKALRPDRLTRAADVTSWITVQ